MQQWTEIPQKRGALLLAIFSAAPRILPPLSEESWCRTKACFFKFWFLIATTNHTEQRWITKYCFEDEDFISCYSRLTALQHPICQPQGSSFKPHHWSCQIVLKATIHVHPYINLPPGLLLFFSPFFPWSEKKPGFSRGE